MIAARQIAFGGSAAKYTAADYIQDGLIAMWDGIENAGWGRRDANATVWKDLVGGRDLTLTSLGSFSSDKALVNAPGGIGAMRSDEVPGFGTLEVVFDAASHSKFSTEYFIKLGTGFVFGKRNGVTNGDKNTSSGNYGMVSDLNVSTRGIALWSLVRPSGVIMGEIWKNGVQLQLQILSVLGAKSTPMTLNAQTYENRFYTIRAYSRALTAEEIAYNYNIDQARFGL